MAKDIDDQKKGKVMKALERLYEASEAAKQLEQVLEQNEGDITGIEIEFEQLAEKAGGMPAAIDSVLSLAHEIEGRAAMRKAEADRLKERAKRDEDIARWFKGLILRVLQEQGTKTLETNRFRATVSLPGGKQGVEITGEVPKEYTVIVEQVTVDKEKIREELESGAVLDFAYLVPKQPYLRVS